MYLCTGGVGQCSSPFRQLPSFFSQPCKLRPTRPSVRAKRAALFSKTISPTIPEDGRMILVLLPTSATPDLHSISRNRGLIGISRTLHLPRRKGTFALKQ